MTKHHDDLPKVQLENWTRIRDRLVGEAYGHPRFEDGTRVVTSRIRKFNPHQGYAITLNTHYVLGKPRQTED